jgi:hypothetical protein
MPSTEPDSGDWMSSARALRALRVTLELSYLADHPAAEDVSPDDREA